MVRKRAHSWTCRTPRCRSGARHRCQTTAAVQDNEPTLPRPCALGTWPARCAPPPRQRCSVTEAPPQVPHPARRSDTPTETDQTGQSVATRRRVWRGIRDRVTRHAAVPLVCHLVAPSGRLTERCVQLSVDGAEVLCAPTTWKAKLGCSVRKEEHMIFRNKVCAIAAEQISQTGMQKCFDPTVLVFDS